MVKAGGKAKGGKAKERKFSKRNVSRRKIGEIEKFCGNRENLYIHFVESGRICIIVLGVVHL